MVVVPGSATLLLVLELPKDFYVYVTVNSKTLKRIKTFETITRKIPFKVKI